MKQTGRPGQECRLPLKNRWKVRRGRTVGRNQAGPQRQAGDRRLAGRVQMNRVTLSSPHRHMRPIAAVAGEVVAGEAAPGTIRLPPAAGSQKVRCPLRLVARHHPEPGSQTDLLGQDYPAGWASPTQSTQESASARCKNSARRRRKIPRGRLASGLASGTSRFMCGSRYRGTPPSTRAR